MNANVGSPPHLDRRPSPLEGCGSTQNVEAGPEGENENKGDGVVPVITRYCERKIPAKDSGQPSFDHEQQLSRAPMCPKRSTKATRGGPR